MEHRASSRHEHAEVPHDEIRTVTSETFSNGVLEAVGPVVVEFMSYGCAHCGAMEPILQRVAAALKGTETIVRVNVAVDDDLAQRYEIAGTPTLVMFLGGRELERIEGPAPLYEGLMAAVTRPFAS